MDFLPDEQTINMRMEAWRAGERPQYSRSLRRLLKRQIEEARKSGQWGAWDEFRIGKGTVSADKNDWSYDVDHVYRNRAFAVLKRELRNGIVHLAISPFSGERPSWPEMQRIKNELAGPEAYAVEVYPQERKVVNGAHMYHLWILPAPLPLGLDA